MSVVVDARITVPGFTVTAALTARQGITVLYGPSGAGKSLVLAAVAGLVRPASGTITISGRTVDRAGEVHVPSQHRRLGMAYQRDTLLPHRSAGDNVRLAVRGVPEAQARSRAAQMLVAVGADHLAEARPATLSGGERQRIGLARALAGDVDTLLLDEPLTALDHRAKAELYALLRDQVDARQLTAVVVTHDVADVIALADSVVRLDPGWAVDQLDVRDWDGPRIVEALTGAGE